MQHHAPANLSRVIQTQMGGGYASQYLVALCVDEDRVRRHSIVEYGSLLWVVDPQGLANLFVDWVVDDLDMVRRPGEMKGERKVCLTKVPEVTRCTILAIYAIDLW